MSKICTGCKVEKSLSEFSIYTNKSGNKCPKSKCKTCTSIEFKEWYKKNLDSQKAKDKVFRVIIASLTVYNHEYT